MKNHSGVVRAALLLLGTVWLIAQIASILLGLGFIACLVSFFGLSLGTGLKMLTGVVLCQILAKFMQLLMDMFPTA
jgi:hypothetical protein